MENCESEDEAVCSIFSDNSSKNTPRKPVLDLAEFKHVDTPTPVKIYHDTCDFGQYRLCFGVSDMTPIQPDHMTSTPEIKRKQFSPKEVNNNIMHKVDSKFMFTPIVESSVMHRLVTKNNFI